MSTAARWVRNAWYMVGWDTDIGTGQLVPVQLLDEPLVLYRRSDGVVVALEDRCPHRLAPLSLGRIEADDIRCLYHGLRFNSRGECTQMPGSGARPKALCARSYPVVERYSAVFVWMGDPARADDSLLPPFVGHRDAGWHMLPGRMDYDVNFELIQDNLLDLSHIAWVHRNSFGGGSEETNKAWAEGQLSISALPHGVRVERWMPDAPTPPHQQAMAGPRCDVLTRFDYLVPGYFLLTSSNYRAGAAARAGSERPTEEPIYSSFTAQAVTPRSSRRTSYYFCFGPWSRVPDGAALAEQFLQLGYSVFEEDRQMLTGQQRIIDADPSRRMTLFDVDRAPLLYRKLVDRLLEAEQAA